MSSGLRPALVIIFLIVLIWILYKSESEIKKSTKLSYDFLTASPEELYISTIGHVNDETSRLALYKAIKKQNSEPNNAYNPFIIANIYRFNFSNTQNHPLSKINKNQQHINKKRQHINKKRNEKNVREHHYYQQALDRIIRYPQQNLNNANTIIDQIDNYYREVPPMVDITPTVLQARDIVRKSKKEKTNTKEDYFIDQQKITSNPQNVHDSQVSKDIKNIYHHIKQTSSEISKEQAFQDIENAINSMSDSTKKQKALSTLGTIKKGYRIESLNDSEDHILVNVWKRINDPVNNDNRNNMVASLVDSLADCIETNRYGNDYQVCTNGRTSRIINSLTLLDENPDISSPPRTKEMIRNEALMKSLAILKDEKSKNPDIAKKYDEGDQTSNVIQFEDKVKNRIEETLKKDYSDINSHDLDNIIKDAQAGI